MAKYTITFSRKAQKYLDKLSNNIAEPILTALGSLAITRGQTAIKTKRRDGYRIRVGDYRIIYEIFDKVLIVDVIDLGHRKDIYE